MEREESEREREVEIRGEREATIREQSYFIRLVDAPVLQ